VLATAEEFPVPPAAPRRIERSDDALGVDVEACDQDQHSDEDGGRREHSL